MDQTMAIKEEDDLDVEYKAYVDFFKWLALRVDEEFYPEKLTEALEEILEGALFETSKHMRWQDVSLNQKYERLGALYTLKGNAELIIESSKRK